MSEVYDVKNILVKSGAGNISLENIAKDLSSVKDEIDSDEIPFGSQVTKVCDVRISPLKPRLNLITCKLCGEGLKEPAISHVCKMSLGTLDNDTKNISHLENSGQGLNEGLSIKGEIDIDEIPFESEVSKEFLITVTPLAKSGVLSDHF